MKYGKCQIPGCGGYSSGNKHVLCRKHEDMLNFFAWAVKNVRVNDPTTPTERPSGLIIPGNVKV